MLKILESIQGTSKPSQANSQEEELFSLMKTFVTPQHHKQVSNIILSSNIPHEEPKEQEIKKTPQIQNKSMKSEDKNSEVLSNDASQKSPNNQNMNDFLFLSKVATMCNQLNVEDRQKKEKNEKEDDAEKDFDEIKLKSKKMYFI